MMKFLIFLKYEKTRDRNGFQNDLLNIRYSKMLYRFAQIMFIVQLIFLKNVFRSIYR